MARRASTSNGARREEKRKGPSFFKIIRPSFNTERVRIPPAFREHILDELSDRATLTLSDSLESSWTVRVIETGSGIYLKEGWEEFRRDNSLDDLQFLVFRYDGNMHFSIDVFEKNACKRIAAPDIRPQEQIIFANNENTEKPSAGPSKGRKAAASKSTPNGEPVKPKDRQKWKFPAFLKTIDGDPYKLNVPSKFCRKHLPSGYYDLTLENTEGVSWKVRAVPSLGAVVLSGGWIDFGRDNRIKEGDDCLFELHSESKMVVYIVRK